MADVMSVERLQSDLEAAMSGGVDLSVDNEALIAAVESIRKQHALQCRGYLEAGKIAKESDDQSEAERLFKEAQSSLRRVMLAEARIKELRAQSVDKAA